MLKFYLKKLNYNCLSMALWRIFFHQYIFPVKYHLHHASSPSPSSSIKTNCSKFNPVVKLLSWAERGHTASHSICNELVSPLNVVISYSNPTCYFWYGTIVQYLDVGHLCNILCVYVLLFIDLCVILTVSVVCLNMCAVTKLSIVFSRVPKTNFSQGRQ